MTLSPILGSELFRESLTAGTTKSTDYSQYIHTHHSDSPKSNKTMPTRPNTADVALREYFASRAAQQEVFDMENFSLHSSDDVSGILGVSILT